MVSRSPGLRQPLVWGGIAVGLAVLLSAPVWGTVLDLVAGSARAPDATVFNDPGGPIVLALQGFVQLADPLAHGLDPRDGSDHRKVMPSGYTAIEEYCNERAARLLDRGTRR